jgi:hypothetical protein
MHGNDRFEDMGKYLSRIFPSEHTGRKIRANVGKSHYQTHGKRTTSKGARRRGSQLSTSCWKARIFPSTRPVWAVRARHRIACKEPDIERLGEDHRFRPLERTPPWFSWNNTHAPDCPPGREPSPQVPVDVLSGARLTKRPRLNGHRVLQYGEKRQHIPPARQICSAPGVVGRPIACSPNRNRIQMTSMMRDPVPAFTRVKWAQPTEVRADAGSGKQFRLPLPMGTGLIQGVAQRIAFPAHRCYRVLLPGSFFCVRVPFRQRRLRCGARSTAGTGRIRSRSEPQRRDPRSHRFAENGRGHGKLCS